MLPGSCIPKYYGRVRSSLDSRGCDNLAKAEHASQENRQWSIPQAQCGYKHATGERKEDTREFLYRENKSVLRAGDVQALHYQRAHR